MTDLASMLSSFYAAYAPPPKAELMRLMTDAGYVRAVVEFSGGGDQGGADNILVFRPDTPVDKGIELPAYNDKNPLSNALSKLPHVKYYSFADDGNFYVAGSIVVDVAEDSVRLEATEEISVPEQNTVEEELY